MITHIDCPYCSRFTIFNRKGTVGQQPRQIQRTEGLKSMHTHPLTIDFVQHTQQSLDPAPASLPCVT